MLTEGTLGLMAGVTLLVGCLATAAPDPGADVELCSGPVEGLESVAAEAPEAGVRTGVSEPE